jgi:hypothetical protein
MGAVGAWVALAATAGATAGAAAAADGPLWAEIARYDDGWARQEEGRRAVQRQEAVQRLNGALEPGRLDALELRQGFAATAPELSQLGAWAGRLNAALAGLEATRFAPTTKLVVSTYFTPGAIHFGGSQGGPYPAGADATGIPARSRNADPAANNAQWGAAAFSYEIHLNLLTSFSGKDLLYTRLNSGNANRSPFAGNPYNLLALDKSTAPRLGANAVEVTRLFYRFPIGRQITALVGPLARPTHEITALRPWFYGADPGPPILDFFALNGAPATYNKAAGAAVGAQWKQLVPEGRAYLAASASYVGPSADNANTADALQGAGIGGRLSRASLFAQVGVGGPGYVVAAAWRRGQCDLNIRRGTQFANQRQPCAPRQWRNGPLQQPGPHRRLATGPRRLAALDQPWLGGQRAAAVHGDSGCLQQRLQHRRHPVLVSGAAVEQPPGRRPCRRLRRGPAHLRDASARWPHAPGWKRCLGSLGGAAGERPHHPHPLPLLPESPQRPIHGPRQDQQCLGHGAGGPLPLLRALLPFPPQG